MTVRPIEDRDVEAVVALWQRCELTRPWNDPRADIAFARAMPTAELLLEDAGALQGAVMVGHDGHRGTVYYLGFYAALGYRDQQCRVLGKRLDGRPDRTPLAPDAQSR